MDAEKIKNLFNVVGGACYSTKETQQHSFDMGKYVVENNIEGDIIECGVASAGNFASMLLGVLAAGGRRNAWGFDSFQGIQLAGKKDTVQAGIGAITHDVNVPEEQLLVSSGITSHSKEQVINNLTNWELWKNPKINIKLVEGWIQNTLPTCIDEIDKISILRLDMDIYAPTKVALEYLFPKISIGGIIIIDDWALDGARIACEEYFKENKITATILDVPNSTPKYFYKIEEPEEPVFDTEYTPEQMFNDKKSLDFDNVRFKHFDYMNIYLKDKTVLELGAGIGNHTKFLKEKMPRKIVSVEGRADNLEILKKRFLSPDGKTKITPTYNVVPVLHDLEKPMSFPDEKFDWIYNYGLLHHLKNPFKFIKSLSSINHDAMVLETRVELTGGENVSDEPTHKSNSLKGKCSRPNLDKLIELLKTIYSNVSCSEQQPEHDWYDIHDGYSYGQKRIVIICKK
jgi:SAM-dependent methyltransferase